MHVIPAIDLRKGRCVRLLQGRREDETVYSSDPASVARRWQDLGASVIHVVDLDGAFSGTPENLEGIAAIRDAVSCDIEVGGGIRDMARIDTLVSMGIGRIILGTAALEDPPLVKEACLSHPGRIFAGIDAREGYVAVRGWVEVTSVTAIDLGRRLSNDGIAGVIYTDISRDGMLTGPNIERTRDMVEALDIPVIASGGISSREDISALCRIRGLWGAITGKALYEGTLDLREALAIARQETVG